MDRKGGPARAHRATIGYAMSTAGNDGVAFVRLTRRGGAERTLRVAFTCRAAPALLSHDVAYAALLAVAREVRESGVRDVVFEIVDARVVREFDERASVPRALAMAYVMLGCELNRFTSARLAAASDVDARDLIARAQADVLLRVAA